MTKWLMPKMPTPQQPPPTPQIDQAMIQFNQDQAMLRKRGSGTGILTSDAGLPNLGSTRAAAASS